MRRSDTWSLNRLIALVLIVGMATLFVEIRDEHRKVLGEEVLSWTPILYTSLMVLLGIAGLAMWERGGRQALLAGFSIAVVVGLLGFWLHNHENPVGNVTRLVTIGALAAEREGTEVGEEEHERANTLATAEAAGEKEEAGPPILAPLAFVGLGLLGVLACARAFQPEERPAPTGGSPQTNT